MDDAGTLHGFTIARCLLTTSRGGFLGVQIDGMGDAATMPIVELHHPYGFLARPRAPEVDGDGCDTLFAYEGGIGHAVLALGDSRHTPLLPGVKEGGSIQYGINTDKKPTFVLMDGDNGSYQVYVPTKGGKACTFAIDVSEKDKEAIQILHALGMGLHLDAETKTVTLHNRTGSCSIVMNDENIILSGNVKIPGGVTMGGAGAVPLCRSDLVTAEQTKLATTVAQIATLLNTPGPVTGAPGAVTPYTPASTAATFVSGV